LIFIEKQTENQVVSTIVPLIWGSFFVDHFVLETASAKK